MTWFLMLTEACLVALALSLDALVAGFAYGSDRIRIPWTSAQIINLICSGSLGLSLCAGTLLRHALPDWLTTAICFGILLVLGIVKLLDSATRAIIRRHQNLHRVIKFSFFNLQFILKLYAEPQDADVDQSKTLSPMEAVSLAVALSLDGIAVGFGAALGRTNSWAVFLCSILTTALALGLGAALGNRVSRKLSFNVSWLSGVLLLLLAAAKLL